MAVAILCLTGDEPKPADRRLSRLDGAVRQRLREILPAGVLDRCDIQKAETRPA